MSLKCNLILKPSSLLQSFPQQRPSEPPGTHAKDILIKQNSSRLHTGIAAQEDT